MLDDLKKHHHLLDGLGMSEEQKDDFARAIIGGFQNVIDGMMGTHPVQLALVDKSRRRTRRERRTPQDVIDYSDTYLKELYNECVGIPTPEAQADTP